MTFLSPATLVLDLEADKRRRGVEMGVVDWICWGWDGGREGERHTWSANAKWSARPTAGWMHRQVPRVRGDRRDKWQRGQAVPCHCPASSDLITLSNNLSTHTHTKSTKKEKMHLYSGMPYTYRSWYRGAANVGIVDDEVVFSSECWCTWLLQTRDFLFVCVCVRERAALWVCEPFELIAAESRLAWESQCQER